MNLFTLLSIVVVTLGIHSEAAPGGLGLPLIPSLPLAGGGQHNGGNNERAFLGPNPYRGFQVTNDGPSTLVYNPGTNRYANINRYVTQGQTRDYEFLGINVPAFFGAVEHLPGGGLPI